MIVWTRVHAIDALRLDLTPTTRPRRLHRLDSVGHSPTRNKRRRISTIKHRGAVRICVTSPIYLPGPNNMWALHLPTPLPRGAPHGRPRGPTWTPATCPHLVRHLRLAWATCSPATWPQCHVASALWRLMPRQLGRWSHSPHQLLQ